MVQPTDLIGMIDHTLLQPTVTSEQIEQICREALEYQFASVCVNSVFVPQCTRLLEGSSVDVCTVVGFPLGASLSSVKAYEAERAIEQGASEIEMMLHVGALKSEALHQLHHDIATVMLAVHAHDAVKGKVILETTFLSDEEVTIACQIAKEAGADFVASSTGFADSDVVIEDVRLMRRVVGYNVGVKATGGVTSLQDALALVEAGATRIGGATGVAIAKEAQHGAASASV